MTIFQNLKNQHVLIAHEDSLQRSCLCEVIQAAGADAYAVTAEESERYGLAFLKPGSCVSAMVLSYTLPKKDAVALIDAALAFGIRIVVVHPARTEIAFPFSDHRCLATPYEGFEVIDALIDVLAASRGCMHWSAHSSHTTSHPKFSADQLLPSPAGWIARRKIPRSFPE
ncbi:hypothetical protein [Sphingomonas faeni]|uniref:hypothetical protein n=1 Tax=Sphingomonas faeni TaxID=185950 RepID=UPI00277DB127|nr:hypothetical protein [Sphingomonas faeni]MDQ0840272.1 hypothetical protein [Sphingomonas faeni]